VPFGIVNQPAVVLLSPTGQILEKWNGTFQAEEVISELP
jgi:hypothetical protein